MTHEATGWRALLAEVDGCDERGGIVLAMPRADRAAAWRCFAETERLNRAIGAPEVMVERTPLRVGEVRRVVTTDETPSFSYEEEGYAWEHERGWVVRRRVLDAPISRWVVSCELVDASGGGVDVHLRFGVDVTDEAARPFARFVASERLPRMFAAIASEAADVTPETAGFADPSASTADSDKLALLVDTMIASGEPARVAHLLAATLRDAADVELAAMHPRRLARAWGVPDDEAIDACLRAARLGFLAVTWSLTCPACRGAKGDTRDLVALMQGVHCDDCNLPLDADARDALALTFRPEPGVRALRGGWACVAGPARTPHVLAQGFVDPGASWSFDPSALGERPVVLRVGARTLSLAAGRGRVVVRDDGLELLSDASTLVVTSARSARSRVAVERGDAERGLVTAGDVLSRPRFRELFSADQWELLVAMGAQWQGLRGATIEAEALPSQLDLVVIGGGPAGEAAAITAGRLGARVALVEARRDFGGSSGLSSKAFREAALRVLARARASGERRGPEALREDFSRTFPALLGFVASLYRADVQRRLSSAGVTLVHGRGELRDGGVVEVACDGGTRRLSAARVLIATGSRAATPEWLPLDQRRVRDAAGMAALAELPRSIVVVGAGVIGLEYATVLAALGTRVDLVAAGELLPFVDREIAAMFERQIVAAGVRLWRDDAVVGVDVGDGPEPARAKLSNGAELRAELLLWATGRVANGEPAGPSAPRGPMGRLVVDRDLVAAPGVWAAGDVLGPPGLASAAATQGKAAALSMFGGESAGERRAALHPTALWTVPEVGTVGLSEDAARTAGFDVAVGRASFRELPRGLLSGDLDGALKLVGDRRTGRVLGAHAIGDSACELVHYGAALVDAGTTAREVGRRVFAAATFHGLYEIAAEDLARKRDARNHPSATDVESP